MLQAQKHRPFPACIHATRNVASSGATVNIKSGEQAMQVYLK
jgi:hypothetical protein